eukprot:CAMPEP_0194298296 /NCGR_PEP_ID=MMETSP0169-20130528/60087_1 /TAXON_ID=218684 /ORGANISM="Corethron pennatum, Strain L29A3" /LENGTH=611 /DNA_ID=CAMNT_0039048267 /DNA_START=41 /DNA_END=1876 /DNA_ORIENTATION=+
MSLLKAAMIFGFAAAESIPILNIVGYEQAFTHRIRGSQQIVSDSVAGWHPPKQRSSSHQMGVVSRTETDTPEADSFYITNNGGESMSKMATMDEGTLAITAAERMLDESEIRVLLSGRGDQRSGNPNQINTFNYVSNAELSAGEVITIVYKYVIGFCSPGTTRRGPTFKVAVGADDVSGMIAGPFEGSDKLDYPYDTSCGGCPSCYSPWQTMVSDPLTEDVSGPMNLIFTNNERNIHIVVANITARMDKDPDTEAPTTNFQGQNYTISSPDISFVEREGDFYLNFDYIVGKTADRLDFSLYRKNCTSDESVSEIITQTSTQTNEEGIFQKEIAVDKTALTESPLVSQAPGLKGKSKGTLEFCVEAEAIGADGTTSVSFLRTDVALSYDLTDNKFEVLDNSIKENTIAESNATIDTEYGVDACQCGLSTFTCYEKPYSPIQQNNLIAICLKPNDSSKSDVEITNYRMEFIQDGRVQYTPASIGDDNKPNPGKISQLFQDSQTHKVVSRLVSALFEGGPSFNVTGVANLQFKTERRHLVSKENNRLRSGQEYLGEQATKTPFTLDLMLSKRIEVINDIETRAPEVILSLVGAATTLLIGIFIFKKAVRNYVSQ